MGAGANVSILCLPRVVQIQRQERNEQRLKKIREADKVLVQRSLACVAIVVVSYASRSSSCAT